MAGGAVVGQTEMSLNYRQTEMSLNYSLGKGVTWRGAGVRSGAYSIQHLLPPVPPRNDPKISGVHLSLSPSLVSGGGGAA